MMIVRATDIPVEEMHLLPIRSLRQQVRRDTARPNTRAGDRVLLRRLRQARAALKRVLGQPRLAALRT